VSGLAQNTDDDDDDLPLTVYHLTPHTHVHGNSALSGRIPLSQLEVNPGGRVKMKA